MRRKGTSIVIVSLLVVVLVQASPAGAQQVRSSANPAPFENNLAPVSPSLRFFAVKQKSNFGSDQIALDQRSADDPTQLLDPVNAATASVAGGASTMMQSLSPAPCDSPAGNLFNLEPAFGSPYIGFPVPQNSESIDYIPEGGVLGSDLVVQTAVDYRGFFDFFLSPNVPLANSWGLSASGYYVHGVGNDCSISFEGGFPHIRFTRTNEILYGAGAPIVAANPTLNRVYAADLRFGATVTGIGLFSTTATRLNDAQFCPNGTHLTGPNGNDIVSSRCWPTATLLNPQSTKFPSVTPDKPFIRADERSQGVGAGDVYVSWTTFDINRGISYIQLSACPYNFKSAGDCSQPETISANDPNTQLSEISVRPDGIVTITYLQFRFPIFGNGGQREVLDIKYVSCQPVGAPKAPACSSPSLVFTEDQPLPFGLLLDPGRLPIWTYPVHDSRFGGNGYEEFVVWARCSVDPFFFIGSILFGACPDADVVMTWSSTDSSGTALGWASPIPVSTKPGNQVMPSISSDHGRNIINIGYLSAEEDAYRRRYQVFQTQIAAGAYEVSAQPLVVTTLPDERAADPFFAYFNGDIGGAYIGVAVRSSGSQSRAYFGFTGQIDQGLLRGQTVSGSNNKLSAVSY